MSIAYGIDVKEDKDPYIDAAEDAMRAVSETVVLGSFFVNVLPICGRFYFHKSSPSLSKDVCSEICSGIYSRGIVSNQSSRMEAIHRVRLECSLGRGEETSGMSNLMMSLVN